jgi:lipopolysaccharide transport system ATP-binding protein
MTAPAIKVEKISKRYRIGVREEGKTFREAIMDLAAAPFRRIKSFGRSSHREEDSIWALKDVSFEVEPGELVGIIGRNGAGKTTLLKILSGVTNPTEGRAVLAGRVGSLLEVGTGFHSELTGRENIYLSGAILGMTRREIAGKFEEIVEFAGVEKFIDTPVKRYSAGMRVRLGFSVAAHLEPEILLIDEVLAVGDAAFQEKCVGKMGNIARGGRTVLYVSHNMPTVVSLCERAFHIDAGRIVASGPAGEVVQEYLRSTTTRPGSISIEDVRARSGTGLVRFKDIQLLDANDNSTTSFSSGSPLRIRFDFDLGDLQQCPGVVVAFSVRDLQDRAILVCSTDFQPGLASTLERGSSLVCTIPGLPLYPDTYYLTASLVKDGALADYLERFARLEVTPGDFYGTGRYKTATGAKALVAHEWKKV